MRTMEELNNWSRIGANVGPGWESIVLALDQSILAVDPDYWLEQCKEKFGGLRYYVSTSEGKYEEVEALIREAEAQCWKTCEACGKSGELRNPRTWMKTLCDECAAEPVRPI